MHREALVAPQRLPHVSTGQAGRIRTLLALLQRLSPRLAARVGFALFLTPFRRQLDPADAAAIARARIHALPLDGETLRIYEWGKGPRTALILHGWGSHAPRFSLLAQALEQEGYRVLAFDAPGHGRSTGKRSSLPQFEAALAAVLACFGPADLLIGHSLGALAITLTLGGAPTPALKHVRGVVLISMPSGAPYLMERYQQLFGIAGPTADRVRQRFQQRFSHPPEYFAAHRVAGRIAVPLLVVHDEGDEVVPAEHSTRFAAAIRGATVHMSKGLGHSGLLRDAATIDVIARFAGEVGRG